LDHPSDPVLERLTRLHPKLIDLSLDRVRRLLGKLGAPHLSLPPVVHVAGTNAKGSVIAMMRAALEAADYKVHVHTSPHLVRFNERIRLAGKLIEDEALIALLEECEQENGGDPITFFEITTCAALLAFSRTPADVVLLETGLGGRLDATNAIREAAVTVITPISMDHQQFLGDSLAAIATEKAGILKPGVPCVMAEQLPEAGDVIMDIAAEIGAPMVIENMDWTIRRSLEEFIVNSAGVMRHLAPPSLDGPHQVHNAGIAVAALERLKGFTVSDAAIIEGFGKIEWPARLQRIRRGRLRAKLGHEFALWLDGGHNAAAAEAIAFWLSERDRMPLHLVLGMINSKDPGKFLEPLKGHIDSLYTVPIPGEAASLSADELAARAREIGLLATPAVDVASALTAIRESEIGPARVLIAGSLYLAGKVLAESGWDGLQSTQD
jgi:dihydrofolate synthase/folylpolyglutamate synthase